MTIDHIDRKIINLLVEGNQIAEIAQTTKRSTRYILYRLSDLKTSFDCKTTVQLIHLLITGGYLNTN